MAAGAETTLAGAGVVAGARTVVSAGAEFAIIVWARGPGKSAAGAGVLAARGNGLASDAEVASR